MVSIDGSELVLASNVTVNGAIQLFGLADATGLTVYVEFILLITCLSDFWQEFHINASILLYE